MNRAQAALIMVLALGAAACGGTGGRRPAPAEETIMEWKGAFCPVAQASHRVVKTQEQWRALWREIGGEAPRADLDSHMAVAVFLGSRPTGGYGVEFGKPAEGADELVVSYRVKTPGEMMVIQAFTQPYGVRLFPKTSKPVRVEALKK